MTGLLSYAIDVDSNVPLFAVAADDTQAKYVWPALEEPFFDDSRIQELADLFHQTPTDAATWTQIAMTNLGALVQVTTPVTVEDIQTAVAEARVNLNQGRANIGVGTTDSPVLSRTREAFDQTSADYPGFAEEDSEEVDPDAMTNFVLQMLGGVEADGPNAWILEAAQNPNPDAPAPDFVRFPGVDYGAVYPEATVEDEPDEETEE